MTCKISRSVGILSKLRNILPFTAPKTLYYSMVHSHLLYGIVTWGNAHDNHLKRLIISQNKAVKIVAGGQRQDHVTPFYHRLQILKLKDLYKYEVAKLMHKNSRKKLPNRLCCHFTPVKAIHTRTTRLALSELNLYLPKYRTQKLQKSFKYQGAKIWNSVPYELKKLPFHQFKLKYKKYL